MIILVLTKNNFAKNLRFWCGFKKLQKKHYEVTLWPKSLQTSYYENYLVHKKFPKEWLWNWWLPHTVIMKQSKTLVRKLWKLWSPRRVAVKLLPSSVSCFWWKPTLRNFAHWTFFFCIPSCFGWSRSNDACLFVAGVKIRNNTL